jgi:mannose-6-phosphate isomerase-like protein (cupin superfamily)
VTAEAFVVELNDEHGFQRLLPGEPETCGMKAGRVYLEAGAECGEHSTGSREEMLVFLSGEGIAFVGNDKQFKVGAGKICYIPPQALHNIKNTGNEPLIYIYCVAQADSE